MQLLGHITSDLSNFHSLEMTEETHLMWYFVSGSPYSLVQSSNNIVEAMLLKRFAKLP
jgi:hypothetical protein